MKEEFILTQFPDEIYSLTTPQWSNREKKGDPIQQSWIVRGSERILVIDSPAPEIPGFRRFIENTFGKPSVYVNTHGHIDHIGCNSQFEEVYMAKADWSLAAGGGIFRSEDTADFDKLQYKLKTLQNNQSLSLGNRRFLIYSLPGHTVGSIVLYEEKTKVLFSGDAIARRILYGLSDWTPLDDYFDGLEKISRLEIEKIYSAHDDFALRKDMPKRIVDNINNNLKVTNIIWKSPVDKKEYKRILLGKNAEDENYFDFVIPNERV